MAHRGYAPIQRRTDADDDDDNDEKNIQIDEQSVKSIVGQIRIIKPTSKRAHKK